MPEAPVAEYLVLGLRLGRLSRGFVQSYTGDQALRGQVDREPAPLPGVLASQARALRRTVRQAALDADREDFLLGQLAALDCAARGLTGAPVSFAGKLRRCFQLEADRTDPERYAAVHAELAHWLPRGATLLERMANFRERERIPTKALPDCVRALSEVLRALTREAFRLPAHERVTYRFRHEPSFGGLQHYLGDGRSVVTVSTAVPHRLSDLPRLLAHESYPGHHTQHCRGTLPEHEISLAPTPQCALSEGLAERALDVLLGPAWSVRVCEVLHGILPLPAAEDLERMDAARRVLAGVRRDAALMLHEHGTDPHRVREYLRRWLLLDDSRARVLLERLSDPSAAAYAAVCPSAYELTGGWLDAEGPDCRRARYARLLDRPLPPHTLRSELSGIIAA
ncbi:hypothetical protein SAMN04487820_101271 [Actinopolyspora mzabensis]|uniref:DUF885 domain-containing protein n=1 Tax=Actinopolyspora mzabensis TaxID=995066 RepID=A0A1G8VR84_ACTMZ|nr:hypothetical protein [Actinopolyspora mzabensis]SDJ68542.1 hypothetical protein SAMN04487820_101271 [Actinopolyspora mzabensis]